MAVRDPPDVLERRRKPGAQRPRPHRRPRTIDRPEQAPLALPGQGAEDFQRPYGRLVHRQVALPNPLRDPRDLGEGRRLVHVEVIQDRADDARRRMARRGNPLDPAWRQERPRRRGGKGGKELSVDQPLPAGSRRGAFPFQGDEFRRGKAEQGVRQRLLGAACLVMELPGGRIQRGVGERRDEADGRQEVVAPSVEAFLVEHQPGRDHLGHLPAEEPLLPRFFHLLADGHLAALPDQLRQVRVAGVVRHPAHRDVRILVARGQGDVEKARCADGVLEEHLVEVAHAEEEDAVAETRLDLHVLPHRGGQLEGHPPGPGRVFSMAGVRRTPGKGVRGSPAGIPEGPACRGPTS